MRNILLILTFLTALAISPNASAQVTLKADTVSINCASSDTFLIPIRVIDFENIGSFQFTLMWDTAKLDYAYTTPINPLLLGAGVDFDSNITQINLGKIAFLWTKTLGASLPDSTIIFNLAFRRIGGSFASLMFVNSPVPVEVASANGDILNVTTVTGGVKPIDDKVPVIICPANVTVQGNGPTPVNGIAPQSVTDNCAPVASIGWASTGATSANQPNDPDASGAVFNIGVSNVTYTVTDVGGNTAKCSFTITVELSNTSDTLTIVAQNVIASCGQSVSINITALNFDSIGSLQFSIGWNPAVLQFGSVGNFNPALQLNLGDNFNTAQTANGLLAFLWTANPPEGVTLPPGATLFTINLNVLTPGGTSSTLAFGDNPVIREAFSNASGSPEQIGAFWIDGSVNVVDNVPPILECPDNVAVDLPTGNTNVQVNGLEPDALQDNCPGNINLAYVRTGATPGSGSGNANGLYNPGVTTVTYTATDAAGNTSACSFTVTVNASGLLTLLADSVEVDCQAGGQVGVNIFVENWDDIKGLQFNLTWDETVLGYGSVGNFNPGLNLTAGDFGETQTANGILIFSAGGPVSNWPQLPDSSVIFTVFFNVINPGATSAISFTGFIEAINSQINSVPVVTVSGFFSAGADTSAPMVTCPPNIPVGIIGNECNASIIVPPPTAMDACSGIASITRVPSGNIFTAGVTQVVYTVTDSAGNSATCSLTVTVTDNTLPSFSSCPSSAAGFASSVTCLGQVNWQNPVAFDPCGQTGLLISSNYTQDSLFPIGQTLVLYTVTDVSANSANCSFIVTIQDTTKPVIVCPDDFTVDSSNSLGLNCAAIVSFSLPITLPDCDSILDITGNFMPNDTFPLGTTTVIFEAMDDADNVSSCSFTITVLDFTAPELICPLDTSVIVAQDTCGAFVNYAIPTVTDNCDTLLTPISPFQPGEFFPVGTTQVTYTATDASGNTGECIFSITVIENVPPIILGCPNDIPILLPAGECDTTASWNLPQASDNCTPDSAIVIIASHMPGDTFYAGTTVVTYTATDASGNSSTCTFRVIAQDEIAPVLDGCPPDVTIDNAKPCGEQVFWTPPTVTDNCTPDSAIVITSSHQSGTLFFADTTTVIIIAKDASNNQTTCSFKITLNKTAQPGFDPANPPDVAVTTTTCSAVATWTPPVPVGFCGVDTIFSTHQPGDTFPTGVTTVTYTAIDSVTNLPSSVSFTVTVTENEPPIITCPAGPIVVNVGGGIISDPSEFLFDVDTVAGCGGVELDFDPPLATDNCGVTSFLQLAGAPPGGVSPVGLDTLIFAANDASGNETLCSVVVEVQALPALNAVSSPRFGCLNQPVMITATPIPGATYTWMFGNQTLTDTDNSISISEFASANEGTYTVVANVGGCTTQPSSVTIMLATEPDAVDDTDITVAPGDTVLFNILENDILVPTSDFDITAFSPLQGLVNLGNGNFAYVAGISAEFLYTVCSKSCPDLCDEALVSITVVPDECEVPNIFTPNGDGINDWLEIPCLDSRLYPDNSLVVYNQWGDKVYEAAPYFNDLQSGSDEIPWRGTLNGKAGQDLPDATYFYIFKPGQGVPVIKGFVEIIR